MTIRFAAALMAALVLGAPSPEAVANPADAYGLGARIPGMGGAGTATSDDTAAGYYNPGGIAFAEHIRIDLGYQYASHQLQINDRDLGVDSSRGVATGVVIPGRVGDLGLALGFTFFFPDRYFSRTRSLEGNQPRFQLFDNRPQRFVLGANVGVAWKDRVAIGGGVSYMSATKAVVELRGRVGFPDASNSELIQGLDADVKTVTYPQAGIMVRALDWLDVGFSYRGKFELELDTTLDIRGSIGGPGMEPVVEDAFLVAHTFSRDSFQPTQLTAGVAAQVTPDLLLTAEVGMHFWSAFRNPATLVDIDIDAGEFNDQIELADPPTYPAPRFDDIVVPRVGAEWRALSRPGVDAFVRGGYSLEPTPAPLQTGESNFIDNDKHTFSAGLGATISGLLDLIPLPFSIDAYFAFTLLPERIHRKVSPVDPVGDYKSDGTYYNVGVGSRWSF